MSAKPKTISMLDFRHRAGEVIREVKQGQTLVLTYRGEPALRLEPLLPAKSAIEENDPFYLLTQLVAEDGASMSNEDIDEVLYG